MKDLTNPTWIKAKGILFLIVGLLAAVLLFLEHPTWKVAVLLMVCVWCLCRFYYFAFYVIEKYIDSSFKFSGLIAALRYVVRKQ